MGKSFSSFKNIHTCHNSKFRKFCLVAIYAVSLPAFSIAVCQWGIFLPFSAHLSLSAVVFLCYTLQYDA